MLVEFIGGYLTGSLALISDAIHMMTDTFALLLALIAIQAGKKAADPFKTYGYARFEILAATLNALILLGIAFLHFILSLATSLCNTEYSVCRKACYCCYRIGGIT